MKKYHLYREKNKRAVACGETEKMKQKTAVFWKELSKIRFLGIRKKQ